MYWPGMHANAFPWKTPGAATVPQLAYPGRLSKNRRGPTGGYGVARADDWRKRGRWRRKGIESKDRSAVSSMHDLKSNGCSSFSIFLLSSSEATNRFPHSLSERILWCSFLIKDYFPWLLQLCNVAAPRVYRCSENLRCPAHRVLGSLV